jgi:hypothetical protein
MVVSQDQTMTRTCWRALTLVMFPFLAGGALHAACLPTLGTDDCARSWDPRIQPMEHRYLDVPTPRVPVRHARSRRHSQGRSELR